MLSTLSVAIMWCLLPLAASAQTLQAETPEKAAPGSSSTKSSAHSQTLISSGQAQPTFLQGEVGKSGSGPGSDRSPSGQNSAHNLSATDNSVQLQSETATADTMKFNLAVSKLASRAQMTAQDYRDLQLGTCGYLYLRKGTQEHARVIKVYSGSPSDEVGIRKGDIIISTDLGPQPPIDEKQSSWTLNFGRPGTNVRVEMQRRGQLLSFTMTRINIEDIQDPTGRQWYEDWAKKLGEASEGTVTETVPKSVLKKTLSKLLN
jgi:hypothetical protein